MTIQQSIFAIILSASASRAWFPEKKLRLSEFMKFDENYDYRNIFNNIWYSYSYHGYLTGRFQSESMQNAIQNTGHEA